MMQRRTFLASLAGAAAAAAQTQVQPAGLRLGIDAYSIRNWNLKSLELIDYSAAQKVDVLQFSSPAQVDPALVTKIKDAAKAANVDLELGFGSICPTSTSWIKRPEGPIDSFTNAIKLSKALGSPLVKAYLGSSADRRGSIPMEQHIEGTLKVLKTVRPLATDLGIKIAMENHSGDLTSRELRSLIEAAGKDWVGCCYDSGNPAHTVEDPMRALEILGPYTITSHMRDIAIFEHPQGAAWQWVPLGDGAIDWPALVVKFKELCPKAPFQLENITGRPPRVVNYLEPDFWKVFPNMHASDFAAFVAFAKRGKPLMATSIIADVPGDFPAEYKTALKQQQKFDLEKGLNYCKAKLGVGMKIS